MNELGFAEMPRVNYTPRIYYYRGYWRVSRVPDQCRNPEIIRRFNLAHQFVARLNNRRSA